MRCIFCEEAECGSASKRRQVKKTTFENGNVSFDKEHEMLTWLRCDLAKHTHVKHLYCKVCKKHAHMQSYTSRVNKPCSTTEG